MTESQMLEKLQKVADSEEDDRVLLSFLELAKRRVLNRMYPYATSYEGLSVPEKYQGVQIEIAAFLMNKRGAEGQTSHSENGISRTYGGSDVPPALMAEITPMCALPM